jgi:hypothetical protein
MARVMITRLSDLISKGKAAAKTILKILRVSPRLRRLDAAATDGRRSKAP